MQGFKIVYYTFNEKCVCVLIFSPLNCIRRRTDMTFSVERKIVTNTFGKCARFR
jgi:hypothetical protein